MAAEIGAFENGRRGLVAALQFLTRLPTPQLADFSPDDAKRAVPWYPVVGAIVGSCVGCSIFALGAAAPLTAAPFISATVGLIVWVWLTGALHLDGLGDVADGLGAAHRDPTRFLQVAREPHAGSFAMIAIGLVLIAKFALLIGLWLTVTTSAQGGMILVGTLALVAAWARFGPLVWRVLVPPLGDGRGAAFHRETRQPWRAIAVNGSLLSLLSLWLAPWLLVALVLLPLIALYWRHRLGGMSGDCHGASIEVTEVALLCAVVTGGTG
ncbi:MAG: adenosylcobinamide-GDP ribazoletransferase [Pseudomonadota bacterium]